MYIYIYISITVSLFHVSLVSAVGSCKDELISNVSFICVFFLNEKYRNQSYKKVKFNFVYLTEMDEIDAYSKKMLCLLFEMLDQYFVENSLWNGRMYLSFLWHWFADSLNVI